MSGRASTDMLPATAGAADWPSLRVAGGVRAWMDPLKRGQDILLVCLALGLFALPMLLIALAVRIDSPGPVFFRQVRTGRFGRPFVLLKYRTLRDDCADPAADAQAQPGDPRLTRLGALLRRTSLDELPQLFNVLRGEMSCIGPRPHAPGTRAAGRLFAEVVPQYQARHAVRPGLTGLAQVRGWRGVTDTEEKIIRRVACDLEYIERWSPWLDLLILLRTVVAVLRMTNAH